MRRIWFVTNKIQIHRYKLTKINTFQATFAEKFWALKKPDVGLVPQEIRAILDQCDLTGSAALGVLDKEDYIKDLERTVTKRFAAIFPQELQPESFKFGLIQKAVLSAIAQAVSSNGIGRYMPTEAGSEKDRAGTSAEPINQAVEKSNSMAKLQERYKR